MAFVFNPFTGTFDVAGANQALSNLTSPTAINQHLIPNANKTFNLGSSSYAFSNNYVQVVRDPDTGGTAINLGTGVALDNNLQSSVDFKNRVLYASGGATQQLGWATAGTIVSKCNLSFEKVNAIIQTPASSNTSENITLATGTTSAVSGVSGNVTVTTGDSAGLTSTSGNISITTGTATQTRGDITVDGANINIVANGSNNAASLSSIDGPVYIDGLGVNGLTEITGYQYVYLGTATASLNIDGVANNVVMSAPNGFQVITGGSKPTAGAAYEGMFFINVGGIGVASTLQMCLKSAADTYSWVTIATG